MNRSEHNGRSLDDQFVVPPSDGRFETTDFRTNAGVKTQKAISLNLITRIIEIDPIYPVCRCSLAGYSNFTDTSFETPGSSIVTPYSARAASIVRLL